MIAPIELNFNPPTKPEMFGVTVERAKAILDHLAACSAHATIRYKEEYALPGEGEFAGKHRLDEGKVMKEFLEVAETIGEWAYIIFIAESTFDDIRYALRNFALHITISKL